MVCPIRIICSSMDSHSSFSLRHELEVKVWEPVLRPVASYVCDYLSLYIYLITDARFTFILLQCP